MILTVATICPASTAAYCGKVAMRDGRIDGVDRVDRAPCRRVNTPAGRAWRLTRPVAAGLISIAGRLQRAGEPGRRLILAEVVRRPGRAATTSATPAASSAAMSSAVSTMRLAQAPVPGLDRVREDRALGVGDGDRSELHAASPASCLRPPEPRERSALDHLGQHRHGDLGRA